MGREEEKYRKGILQLIDTSISSKYFAIKKEVILTGLSSNSLAWNVKPFMVWLQFSFLTLPYNNSPFYKSFSSTYLAIVP